MRRREPEPDLPPGESSVPEIDEGERPDQPPPPAELLPAVRRGCRKVRRRRPQEEPSRLIRKPRRWVDVDDIGQVGQELPLEIPWPPVVGTKLGLESLPRDEARLAEVAHSVGEPRVDVEGERRALQISPVGDTSIHCK